MCYLLKKFNWCDLRAYLSGNVFPEETMSELAPCEHGVDLAFHTVQEIISARNWLDANIANQYHKFGIFMKHEGHFVDKNVNIPLRCIGVRFQFDNDDDVTYFRMCCHTGEKLDF
jgi:hypothetical protein